MKLINKFTLWYLSITLTCTIAGTAITFFSIKKQLHLAAVQRLGNINNQAAEQLKEGRVPEAFIGNGKVEIKPVEGALPAQPTKVSEASVVNPETKAVEERLVVTSWYAINNKSYSVSSYDFVTSSEQILSGLEASIGWKWLIILSLIAVTGGIASRLILAPFNKSLKAIESFNLRQKEKLQLPQTGTKEFKQLNAFLQKMTAKAVEDYNTLKEFAENASHELQTPVAVMRGKLELLAESGLEKEQARLIADIQTALEKLSRINSSLTLLTKLENHEYEARQPICFSELIHETIQTYSELADMKSLTITTDIRNEVLLYLHPSLADLLLNNLMSNAIRHNIPNGTIHVTLTNSFFSITNTGRKPEVPTAQLFKRFKKSNQCDNSIGIGLAIVKQICDLNNFPIQYSFENGSHELKMKFSPTERLSGNFPGNGNAQETKVVAGSVLQG
ncbi:MAG: sensor histidine kinase [Agriterribacter sp.]